MVYISDILYWISTGLLVPVIILLIILFVRSLMLIGGFFSQYTYLRKNNNTINKELKGLTFEGLNDLEQRLPKSSQSLSIIYMKELLSSRGSMAHVNRILADFEIAADKDLALSKTLTKLGPMLGLMGTLIPMGPALVGLAAGDISSMAYNMQVAFATTVVGIFVSAIGFITQQIKQRWYLQDMTNLEFLAELIENNKKSC